MIHELILRNCVLLGSSEQVDIVISDAVVVAIEPKTTAKGKLELDCLGAFVSPPFVESHIHLDSVFTAGEPYFNKSGTLFEGIEIWKQRKKLLTYEDVQKRALRALQVMAEHGVLFVRTHVDVTEYNLLALTALLDLREQVKNWMTLQVVAFPQDGIFSKSEHLPLLKEAMKQGVDVIGGIPHYELTREDGVRSIQTVFDLAEQYGTLIDIHCDEIDDEQSRFVETIVAEAIKRGNGSQVTASHTTAFASYNDAYADKLMGFLQRTNINFVANPLINITLQGRMDSYPKRRGVTRVKELIEHGQNLSLGQDCIADPWYRLGTGSMLDVAYMIVHVSQMTGQKELESCFEMITHNGAKTLAVEHYGITVGQKADMIVLNASDPIEAISKRLMPRYVISNGALIAQTIPASTHFESNKLSNP